MGGFVYPRLYDFKDKILDYVTLTGSELRSSGSSEWFNGVTFHPLRGLVLDKRDIENQSKADGFLKTIAVLQITWIVLTVLVRGVTGLPLTQLEIATLAYSIFAILTYAANWWKPKDVSRPVRLQFRKVSCDISNPDWQSFVMHLTAPADAAELERRTGNLARIPNDMIWMEEKMPLIFGIMAMSALVFGGLHCLAWNFEFPSHIELILCRTVSLISAILPLLSIGISLCLNYLATTYADKKLVPFLMVNLPPWDLFPSEYWELLKNPTIETGTGELNSDFENRLRDFNLRIRRTIEIREKVNIETTRDTSLLKVLEDVVFGLTCSGCS